MKIRKIHVSICLLFFGALSLSGCPKKTSNRARGIDGLECIQGEINCACGADSSCDEGLSCLEGFCVACNQDKIGCPCDAQCENLLVCDAESMTCQDSSACVSAGCLIHQFCQTEEGEEAPSCIENTCEPGFVWNAETSTCDSVPGAVCEGEGELAIADDCAELNRVCMEREVQSTRCGNCLDGSVPTESPCANTPIIEQCVELGCTGQNRACVEVDLDEYACGECLQGFERDLDGRCSAAQVMGCGVCDLQNRDCLEIGNMNRCGNCFEGFVENGQGQCVEEIDCAEGQIQDLQTNECRDVRVCGEDVQCAEGEICTQAEGQDAQCSEGCPNGWAMDIAINACRPCGGIVPECRGIEGTTGRPILKDSAANAICICEPIDGYYPGSEGVRPVSCDEDRDGWISDSALRFMEEDNPISRILRDNCDLRKIDEVLLRNDKGEELVISFRENPEADEQLLLDGGSLPLYETAKNDVLQRLGEDDHSPYGGVPIHPRALNSFTKACADAQGDYNDNSVADVEESVTSALVGRLSSPGFAKYYNEYLRFSYYMELYDGWYEKETLDNGEVVQRWVIEERARLEQLGNTLPLRYPSERFPSNGGELWYSFPDGADHVGENWEMPIEQWRVCDRKMDTYYTGVGDDEPVSRAGGDFTEPLFASRNLEGEGERWTGLNHHSQFKCVLFESSNQYDTTSANRTTHPHMVYQDNINDPHLNQKEPNDLEAQHRWTLNRCRATDETRLGMGMDDGGKNAAFQNVECDLVDIEPIENDEEGAGGAELLGHQGPEAGTVYWAAVGYQNYASNRAEGNTAPPYERGCINECDEWGVAACPVPPELGFEPQTPRFTCDDESPYIFGKLQCGCGLNYGGGALCDMGCPEMEVRYNATFNIETREGVWMCGKLTGSQGPISVGGDFSLRGGISVSGTDGRAMASGNGQFVLRGR